MIFAGGHYYQPAGQQQLCGSGGGFLHKRAQRKMERSDDSGYAVRGPRYETTHAFLKLLLPVALTTAISVSSISVLLESDSTPTTVRKETESPREVGHSLLALMQLH